MFSYRNKLLNVYLAAYRKFITFSTVWMMDLVMDYHLLDELMIRKWVENQITSFLYLSGQAESFGEYIDREGEHEYIGGWK